MDDFTPQTLGDLGIQLPVAETQSLADHLNETLKERIGFAIFDLLDDDEAEQLIQLQALGNEHVIADWLKVNVPEYQEVIEDEYTLLASELVDHTSQLV